MPVDVSTHTAEFFAAVMPAVVGTKRKSGRLRLNAAWFEYADGYFLLNSWRGASWLDNIERERYAVLFLIDPKNMYRTAEIQTQLVETSTEGALEHIDRLSHRYQGGPYRSPRPQERVIIKLDPVRLRSTIDQWAQLAAADTRGGKGATGGGSGGGKGATGGSGGGRGGAGAAETETAGERS
jgi:uncharacterized membrane protein YgcG